MNTFGSIDVVMKEHKLRTARADRIGWMVDDLNRSRKGAAGSGMRKLTARAAGVVAALVGLLLAAPTR